MTVSTDGGELVGDGDGETVGVGGTGVFDGVGVGMDVIQVNATGMVLPIAEKMEVVLGQSLAGMVIITVCDWFGNSVPID